ncbi:hypothetical protein D3C83_177690 [compost metagenome]
MNLILSKTPEGSPKIEARTLGSTPKVREEMCGELRQAGWKIVHFIDDKEGKDEYILE